MTTLQKVIKYLALALAFFIIVSILMVVIKIGYKVISMFEFNNKNDNAEITTLWMQKEEIINSLEIDLKCTNLSIKNGSKIFVKTNSSDIEYKNSDNQLSIKENKNRCLTNNKKQVIVYLPDNLKLDNIKIDSDAGSISIDNLLANKIDFKLDAGNAVIKNINTNEIEIDTSAGSLRIDNGIISNMDLDLGVGEANITAQILGNSKLNTGVGQLKLNLLGSKDEYKIKVSKGLGEIKIDNISIKDNEILGNGNNFIDISNGVGEITVDYIS